MRRMRWFAALALGIAMVAIAAGCAGSGEDPAPGSGSTSAEVSVPPEKTRTLTADTLPTRIGTTWEVSSRETETPIDMSVEGPWTFETGPDWRVDEHEIVDPASAPGIESFSDVTFVVRNVNEGATYYYPRRVTDEWLLHLGRIEVKGDQVAVEPLQKPSNFWPLGLEVGKEYVVQDEGTFLIEATVLAHNTATTPAGVVEDVYLVRFVYTPQSEGAEGSVYYYMFAPDVGFVALVHPSAGDEAGGFTGADSISVITRLPQQ